MLKDEKILITGAAGIVGYPLARELAKHNTVFGMARFSDPADVERLKAIGVTPIQMALGAPDYDGLPDDFTYVFNLAAAQYTGLTRQYAFEVNVQGTGRLMTHCRNVEAFFHCSAASVYKYQGHQPLREEDDLDVHLRNFALNYGLSRICSESVVEFVAREHEIPTVIARLAQPYATTGGIPDSVFKYILDDRPIRANVEKPTHVNLVYEDDFIEKAIALVDHAASPPLVVNWCSSERTSLEEYATHLASLVGKTPKFRYDDQIYGSVYTDPTFMESLVGQTKVHWRDGLERMVKARHPDVELVGV